MEFLSPAVEQLLEADWLWEKQDNPEFSSQAGAYDMTWSATQALQDVSPAGYQRRAQHSQEMIEQIDMLLRTHTLSKEETLYVNMLRLSHVELIQAIEKCPFYLIPVNTMYNGGLCYSFLESIEWMRFEVDSDFEVLLTRLQAFPNQVNQYIEAMREGMRRGFTASKPIVADMEGILQKHIDGETFGELEDPLSKLKERAHLAHLLPQFEEGIRNAKAAFTRALEFFKTEYTPTLRDVPGCVSLPNGAEIYAMCLKFHTGTDLTADQVHEIGLREVAKIESRYNNDVLVPLGFGPDDFVKFVEKVRSDPAFYVDTDDKLLNVYVSECQKIREIMPLYFAEQPRSPMDIVKSKGGPCAYYLAGTDDGKRPGRFYVNVTNLTGKPTYERVALSLHEGIPGHHHQLSLAMENATIPKVFRYIEDRRYEIGPCRRPLFTSYAEGWALYCEYLGEEMGMYQTPYDLFGRLSMDMMRAVRLVVDTGLHSKGWSIEQAVDYMMQKTGMHRHEVTKEIVRYATWPGQACAYKIGQLELLRMRKKAEDSLGAKFDLKKFHSVVLMSGALPMNILEDLVDAYIAQNA